MKKIIVSSLFLGLMFWANHALTQENEHPGSYHNTYLELGGMYLLGTGINYEYSFKVFDFLRINPGIGARGYIYRRGCGQTLLFYSKCKLKNPAG